MTWTIAIALPFHNTYASAMQDDARSARLTRLLHGNPVESQVVTVSIRTDINIIDDTFPGTNASVMRRGSCLKYVQPQGTSFCRQTEQSGKSTHMLELLSISYGQR